MIGVSIVKRPWKDGNRVTYALKYRLPDGRQKMKKAGFTRKEAERARAELLVALSRGTHRELKPATFKSFSTEWLTRYAEPRYAPSTLDHLRRNITKHLLPVFGDYPLQAI